MANEELIERIAAVNPGWVELIRAYTIRVERRPIPFYQRFQLLTVTVNVEGREMEFRYADDGTQLCVLRATPDHIYTVNRLEGLRLDAGQIPDYLRFFFDNLTGPG